MNKKILKALFTDVASNELIRPHMTGVHFEERRCYATDTHILVIYNESDPRFVGQTIGSDGLPVHDDNGKPYPGKFPDIDRVFPKAATNEFKGDPAQLYRAMKWWKGYDGTHQDDAIVIGGQTVIMATFRRILSVFDTAGELRNAKIMLNEQGRPVIIKSPSLSGLLMPSVPVADERIDDVRSDGERAVISYANLINTYAIESAKPKATSSSWDWL